jgi:hypothetical protein
MSLKVLTSQRGAASLIGVTIASFLVVLLVTSMAALMIGELRQATDAENSVKAYYEAQSGTEEAILRVKNVVNDPSKSLASLNQNCDKNVDGSDRDGTTVAEKGVTCYAIRTLADGSQTFVLNPDQPTQVNLTGLGIDQVKIEWDVNPSKSDQPFTTGNVNGSVAAWQGTGSPPPVELTLVAFPKDDASFAASSLASKQVVLVPCLYNAAGSNLISGINAACPPANGVLNLSSPPLTYHPVNCLQGAANSFRCTMTVNGLSLRGSEAVDSVLRLRPRFIGASYKLTAFDAAGNRKDLPLQYAQIDVTAKTGDSFRRVLYQVQIRSGAVGGDVLFGDSDICKDFELLQAEAAYNVIKSGATCQLN